MSVLPCCVPSFRNRLTPKANRCSSMIARLFGRGRTNRGRVLLLDADEAIREPAYETDLPPFVAR